MDTCKNKTCIYQRSIPYDCHIRCAHPSIPENGIGELISMMNRMPIGFNMSEIKRALNIRGSPHGTKNGWFNWPYNFDPIWLESCSGFKEAHQCPGC